MTTAMHESNKNWDPGTIAPYMRQGSTSCQEYDALAKLRNLDVNRTLNTSAYSSPRIPIALAEEDDLDEVGANSETRTPTTGHSPPSAPR